MKALLVPLLLFALAVSLSLWVFTQPEQRLYRQSCQVAAAVFAAVFVFILALGLIHSTV